MPVMEWGICNNLNYTKWGQERKIAIFRPCFLWFHRKIVKKPLTNMYGGILLLKADVLRLSYCSKSLCAARAAHRAEAAGDSACSDNAPGFKEAVAW